MPLRTPLELKLKPGGRLPLATLQLYGDVPPEAVSVSVYEVPVDPEVSVEDEVMVSGVITTPAKAFTKTYASTEPQPVARS